MNNDTKYERALSVIDQLLVALAAEQSMALSQRDTMATDEDLASVGAELQRRREQLLKRCLPPSGRRYRMLTRQVTDSWRLGSKIGNEIAAFEAMFERL
jgi:hypothetical protein